MFTKYALFIPLAFSSIMASAQAQNSCQLYLQVDEIAVKEYSHPATETGKIGVRFEQRNQADQISMHQFGELSSQVNDQLVFNNSSCTYMSKNLRTNTSWRTPLTNLEDGSVTISTTAYDRTQRLTDLPSDLAQDFMQIITSAGLSVASNSHPLLLAERQTIDVTELLENASVGCNQGPQQTIETQFASIQYSINAYCR